MHRFVTPLDFWRAGFEMWVHMAHAQLVFTSHFMAIGTANRILAEADTDRATPRSETKAPITLAAVRAARHPCKTSAPVIPFGAYAKKRAAERAVSS